MPEYDNLVVRPETARRLRDFKRYISYRDEEDYTQDGVVNELLDAAAEQTGWDE